MFATIVNEYEGQFGHGRTIEDIIDWVESLPPVPGVASRAMKLMDDPNSSASEIAAVLTRDSVLASCILRAANTAAFGRGQAAANLDEAILTIGLGRLRSMLLAVMMKHWNKSFGPLERLVWEKSLGAAAAADVVATHVGKAHRDQARLAGLLHNIGQVVLLSHPTIRTEYPNVITYIREHQTDYATAEREVIGFSYPLVGALVARKWDFPMPICLAILHHNDPFEGIDNQQDKEVAVVKFAAELALCAGLGLAEGCPTSAVELKPLAVALGFQAHNFEQDLEVLMRQVKTMFETETKAYA